MTCLDIAHTLHELANEGKLISGHALDIMQGTTWDYYAQKNESRQQQQKQNATHLPECQQGTLTKHLRHRHWVVHELAKTNKVPETG